ncbi:hypothetical protein D3C73_1362170 [compost metagenome]
MPSLTDYPAFVQHDDVIRTDDRLQPVGNHDDGAPLHQPVDRPLHIGFVLRI